MPIGVDLALGSTSATVIFLRSAFDQNHVERRSASCAHTRAVTGNPSVTTSVRIVLTVQPHTLRDEPLDQLRAPAKDGAMQRSRAVPAASRWSSFAATEISRRAHIIAE